MITNYFKTKMPNIVLKSFEFLNFLEFTFSFTIGRRTNFFFQLVVIYFKELFKKLSFGIVSRIFVCTDVRFRGPYFYIVTQKILTIQLLKAKVYLNYSIKLCKCVQLSSLRETEIYKITF